MRPNAAPRYHVTVRPVSAGIVKIQGVTRAPVAGSVPWPWSLMPAVGQVVTDPRGVRSSAAGHRPNTTLRLEKRWKIGDRGAEYEFDVKSSMKLRGLKISDAELEDETRYAINVFAAQLRKDYPWVGRVGQSGRSGGWLLVEDKTGGATEADLRAINDRVDAAHGDFEDALVAGWGYVENGGAIDPKLRKAYDFFRAHAGGIVGENAKGALRLARAEARAEELGWYTDWEEDPEEYQMGDAETERPFEVLGALLKDENGEVLESLGGIGMSGNASQDRTYGRVVEAELALEALHRKGLL